MVSAGTANLTSLLYPWSNCFYIVEIPEFCVFESESFAFIDDWLHILWVKESEKVNVLIDRLSLIAEQYLDEIEKVIEYLV